MLIKTYACPQNINGGIGQQITENVKFQCGIIYCQASWIVLGGATMTSPCLLWKWSLPKGKPLR